MVPEIGRHDTLILVNQLRINGGVVDCGVGDSTGSSRGKLVEADDFRGARGDTPSAQVRLSES